MNDDLQKIRLRRNDLLLLRFWPQWSKLVSALVEFYHASVFVCFTADLTNLFVLLTQPPVLILCYRRCIMLMHATVHVAN